MLNPKAHMFICFEDYCRAWLTPRLIEKYLDWQYRESRQSPHETFEELAKVFPWRHLFVDDALIIPLPFAAPNYEATPWHIEVCEFRFNDCHSIPASAISRSSQAFSAHDG